MNNFGEELAYWYFRLNGFFLINNFVLHRTDLGGEWDADSDLIGFRNPNTFETIGLADDDICDGLLQIAENIRSKQTALICEVKAGQRRGVLKLGDPGRLHCAIKRIGVFSADELVDVQNQLENNSGFSDDRISIHKIVISRFAYEDNKFSYIPLDTVEQHILRKFKKYGNEKGTAWTYFPSSLMQYLIWSSNRIVRASE